MAYTWDENVVSDLHKDAYGFRPSATWWAQWKAMDGDQRQAEWEAMCATLDEEQQRRREVEQRNLDAWSTHVHRLARENGVDLATAIRWDMQAMDAGNDVGYYCFRWDMSYDNEDSIKRVLEEVA